MVVKQVQRYCVKRESEGVEEVDLTDTWADVMVEGLVAAIGIELLGLYREETTQTVVAAYPDQQIGASARLVVPGGVDDAEGIRILKVQHFENEEISECLLTQAHRDGGHETVDAKCRRLSWLRVSWQ